MRHPEVSPLAREDRRLLGPLATLPCAAAIVDIDTGAIRACNPAWQTLAGRWSEPQATCWLVPFPSLSREDLAVADAAVRRAVPASAPGGAVTWWDLELAPHPDLPGAVTVTAREVTETILAERDAEGAQVDLSATGVRLDVIKAATGIGLWEWDLDDDVQSWSPNLFRLFGMDPASNRPPSRAAFLAMIHPLDRDAVAALVEERFGDGERIRQVEFRVRPDGNGPDRWVLLLGRATVFCPEGRARRAVGISLDITERRREHQLLVESETRLRLAFAAAQMFAWEWNIATGKVTWTGGAARVAGPETEGCGQSFEVVRALIHPDDLAVVDDALAGALGGDPGPCAIDFRTRRQDGTWGWTTTHGLVVRDERGAPARMIGVAERRDPSLSAPIGASRVRAFLDSLPLAVFSAGADGSIDFLSRHWFDYTGQERAKALGLGWADALHPEDRERTLATWAAARETRSRYRTEHRLRAADGGYHWFLTGAALVADPEAAGTEWVGCSVDVTPLLAGVEQQAARMAALTRENQRSREDLLRAAHELETEIAHRSAAQSALSHTMKLETLGLLTTGVAHDFNNVLAAVIGSYGLIRRRAGSDDVLKVIEHGEHAVARARQLVRKLLTFGRREDPARETLDLRSAIGEVEDLVRHAAGDRVLCSFDVPDGVWPVLADPQLLGVALINLAVNARDAMPDGGALVVSAANLPPGAAPFALPPGDYVAVAVRDNGVGMPEDVLARAREAFFTTKPRGLGTGLGLATVHEFAVGSGGAMQIESTLGMGTTVTITLPRAPADRLSPEELNAIGRIAAPRFDAQSNASILLVEDDDRLRPVTAATLRALGYGVVATTSAERASVLLHLLPDVRLLLTDVELRGESGLALAERLLAQRPGLAVLFMTANQPPSDLSADSVLIKPFGGSALAQAVLRKLNRAEEGPTAGEALLFRLHSARLRAMLLAWHRARETGQVYPRPEHLDPALHGLDPYSFVAVLEQAEPPRLRCVRIGPLLQAALARLRVAGGDDVIGPLEALYARCAETSAPVYHAGDCGESGRYRRLVLPCSEDGVQVTHLVGLVEIEED